MKACATHHHACDCREEKFRKMEAALKVAREVLEFYGNSITTDFVKRISGVDTWADGKTARDGLEKIDKILGESE